MRRSAIATAAALLTGWMSACAGAEPAAAPTATDRLPRLAVVGPGPQAAAVPEPLGAPDTEPAPEPTEPAEPKAPEPRVIHPFHEPLLGHANASATRHGNLSPAACLAELGRRKLATKRVGGNVRGIATPLRLNGPIRGVRIAAPGAGSRHGILDCRLVLAIDELARIAAKHGVVAVRADNFYRPGAHLPGKRRTRSQHAHGLAMDVTSFELADGRRLVVERDWQGAIGARACGPEAELDEPSETAVLLRNLVCELAREGVFHHLLTPGFDPAHRTHLHLDIKRDARATIVR
jgi:hypothetical protein